jgi:CubicO group peptidase (beta-lactamase class C family)
MLKSATTKCGALVCLVALLLLGRVAVAQSARPAAAAKQPPASSAQQLTGTDLEAFLGGFLPAQLERDDIAGAVVVVVKDGAVLFSRGYGYSDAEKKKPVSVDETLFRPGSVSKLFTATAVMQLIEQGKLDLDRDVNDYIDFKIPATYSQPITLRRVFTHTTGFEEVAKELFVKSPEEAMSLRSYLVKHIPPRIYAPGTMPAYSNYALALAGYIVERVSGEKFVDYANAHIYAPLGMTHATFAQPLPPSLEPLMSSGYTLGSAPSKSFEVISAAPAGSMSVSGGDIGKFMIAHLQDGRFGNTQILRPETARLMHSRQFSPDPNLLGMCVSFFDESRNGHTIIGHGGDTRYFHSHLSLIMDSGVGFFISVNSAGKGGFNLRGVVWEKFLDRYFPGERPAPVSPAAPASNNPSIFGPYLSTRRGEVSLLKPLAILGQPTVSARPDGTVEVSSLLYPNGKPRQWQQIAPMLYQDRNGQGRILFKPDSAGRMQIFGDFGAAAYQRARWSENVVLCRRIALFALGVFGITLILWPIGALVRWHYDRRLELSAEDRRRRRSTLLVCALQAAVMLAWCWIFIYAASDPFRLNASLDMWIYLAEILTVVAAAFTIVAIWNALRALTGASWWWTRVHAVLIAVACVGVVWLAFVARVFSFNVSY